MYNADQIGLIRLNTIRKIALLFGLESKVNRDRFSGILRYSARTRWEVRTYTLDDIGIAMQSPPSSHNALWLPDGIIFVGNNRYYADFCKFFQRLSHRKIPCVVIDGNEEDRRNKPNGEILTDDRKIGREAAAYFMKKGFANFATIGTRDKSELWHSHVRLSSYSKTLQDAGFECQTIQVCDSHDGRILTIPEIAEKLNSLPAPCAVFVYSDEVARYVLDACRYKNIPVPERLSILGVDDQTEITENTRPPLSSILPDFESSGFLAAEMLDAILTNRPYPLRAYTSKILCINERASTQDIRGGGRIVRIASEYIRLHLTEPIHTSDIGKALNLSPRLIEMRFRETLNCSVREKITALRIEKATQLMMKSDMSFAQIAFVCGYSTPDGLRLAFRKCLGMTMSEWRNTFVDTNAKPDG